MLVSRTEHYRQPLDVSPLSYSLSMSIFNLKVKEVYCLVDNMAQLGKEKSLQDMESAVWEVDFNFIIAMIFYDFSQDPPALSNESVIKALESATKVLNLSHKKMIRRAHHDSLFMAGSDYQDVARSCTRSESTATRGCACGLGDAPAAG
ncbi:hypothetical protein L6452_36326 [Arctium lappa]|uniref:Uncharacterized protein n=1 Tax=Arctium lappa TaxID=4217 RepID=A0ACB8Y9C7_ARCLA|nr:hypothetical protein L6452_36326 [Arctium lappa]